MSGNNSEAIARFSAQLGQCHEEVDLDTKLQKIGTLEEQLKKHINENGKDAESEAFRKELIKAKNTYSLEKMDQFDKGKI